MEKKDFKFYEYITITVDKNKIPLYVDTYESFGYELIDTETTPTNTGIYKSKLNFKRDRKINNKSKLNSLLKDTEISFAKIDKYEAQKTSTATMKALIIGFIACTFLALSVFFITDMLSLVSIDIVLEIIFGTIGIILCIPPYFVYQNNKIAKTEELQPLIEEEFDKIADLCEKANKLINE